MSVQNDTWITVQSTEPTGTIWTESGRVPVLLLGDWCHALDGGRYWTATSGYEAYDRDYVPEGWKPMIYPFYQEQVKEFEGRKLISYGLSSYGYDVRLAEKVQVFSNIHSSIIDPKRLDEKCLVDATIRCDKEGAEYALLPPNSYLLGHTVEMFRIPRDILVVALGKSTYARAGLQVNVTPLEPEWEGQVVVEVSNGTTSPMKVYLNEGIAQFIFLKGNEECAVSYGDRAGKYQGQRGITLGKV